MMKKIQDERVISVRRKVQSDLAQMLLVILIASVLVQQIFLDAPLEQYLVEMVCFIVGCFYIIIGNIWQGVDIFREKNPKKMMFLNALVASLTGTLVNAALNYSKYKEHYTGIGDIHFLGGLLIFFISMLVSSSLFFWLLYSFNKRKQSEIQRHLDEEE